jgi:uncharacterized membrane protein
MTVGVRGLAGLALVAIVVSQFSGLESAIAGPGPTCCSRAAPGPIVGAGLPILAIGFGAYWLMGRFRRTPN